MRYRVVKPKGKDKELCLASLARCGGKCEALVPIDTLSLTFKSCGKQPVSVCKLDDGTFICYCNPCRYAALGLSPGEKTARTKQFKSAQRKFFDDDI